MIFGAPTNPMGLTSLTVSSLNDKSDIFLPILL